MDGAWLMVGEVDGTEEDVGCWLIVGEVDGAEEIVGCID
jgi:hypothetical protein